MDVAAELPAELTEELTPRGVEGLQEGDVIEAVYYGFWHLYVVESVQLYPDDPVSPASVQVIHYGRGDLLEGIKVLRENLELKFDSGGKYRVYRLPQRLCRQPEEVLQRARERLGDAGHSLQYNNGTLFALRCKVREEAVEQVLQRVRAVRPAVPSFLSTWFT